MADDPTSVGESAAVDKPLTDCGGGGLCSSVGSMCDACFPAADECQVVGPHCSCCGSTDEQDIAGGWGYTSCCNEPVTNQQSCSNPQNHEEPCATWP